MAAFSKEPGRRLAAAHNTETIMKHESYTQFKNRIAKEGYTIERTDVSGYYIIHTPGHRQMTGTLKECKEFIGE